MTDVAAAATSDDYQTLRAERDRLRERVETLERRAVRRSGARRVAAATLVVIASLAFLAAMPGVWAERNFLDTDRFVAQAGPLIETPEFQEVLATRLTDEVMVLVDPEALFEQVLPERGEILAVPLANAVEGFVRDRIASFVASDLFARLWGDALRVAHTQALAVLEGDSDIVTAGTDSVRINLVPAINAVLANITYESPEILGRRVSLPDITVENLQGAIQALEEALGVQLDDDFGQFTFYDNGTLSTVQQALRTAGRLVIALVALTVVATLGALWVSTNRRRTLIQLAAGAAVAAVLVRRLVVAFSDDIVALAPTDQGSDAVAVAGHRFVEPLTTFAGWTLLTAAAVTIVALVTGPYPWAVATRSRVATARRVIAHAARGARDSGFPSDSGTAHEVNVWIRDHAEPLTVGLVAVVALLLWVIDMSWLAAVLVLAAAGVLAWVIRRAESTVPPPHSRDE